MTGQSERRRVVIVGGGFAGLFAVRRLRRGNVSVTLIDRAQHHVFQPLLYQCATGILSRDVRRERTFTTQQIETLRDVYAPPAARRQF